MKHKAKAAGQSRHAITTLGGGIMADAMAGAQMIQQMQAELGVDFNISPTAEFLIGLGIAVVGFIASWRSRAKKIGEGDIE